MADDKNILVLNSGSSSLKCALVALPEEKVLLSSLAERLGEDAVLKIQGESYALPQGATHALALKEVVAYLERHQYSVDAIGHRVVHGGEAFTQSCLITESVKTTIHELAQLAPLHNPANLEGILSAESVFEGLPQVAVFDTSFHQTLPAEAFTYALPIALYQKHGIRRYGFHGTSHRYVSEKARGWLSPDADKLITVHLGNGASLAAVSGGRSLDTSMGLTPLEGLVMGTRCGDLDPSLAFYLVDTLGYTMDEVQTLFNKQSGLLGLSDLSNDCRRLLEARAEGHSQAKLALAVFVYRVAKYIASYLVPLGGLDALVFTGGIGENAAEVRAEIMAKLGALGFELDVSANSECVGGKSGVISKNSKPLALVVPTNEELMIALDTYQIIKEG